MTRSSQGQCRCYDRVKVKKVTLAACEHHNVGRVGRTSRGVHTKRQFRFKQSCAFAGPTPDVRLLSVGCFGQNIARLRIVDPPRHKIMESGLRNFATLQTYAAIREGCTCVMLEVRKGQSVHREVVFLSGCHGTPTVFDFTRCKFLCDADARSHELRIPCIVQFSIGPNRVAEDFRMVHTHHLQSRWRGLLCY